MDVAWPSCRGHLPAPWMTIFSQCNNSWWVILNKLAWLLRVQFGHSWTHQGLLAALCQQRQQKCGEVGSAVFHAPPVWHKPVSPLLCLLSCVMFFMADRLAAAWGQETKRDWVRGQDKGKGERERERESERVREWARGREWEREREGERERERERGREWEREREGERERVRERRRDGKSWRCWTGFPCLPLPRIPSQSSGLCQPEACPGTFLSTDFSHHHSPPLALCVPTVPPRLAAPVQTMNKRACLRAAAKPASRGETLPGDGCQQQQEAGSLSPESQEAEQETGRVSICRECHALMEELWAAPLLPTQSDGVHYQNYHSHYEGPQWTSRLCVVIGGVNKLEFRLSWVNYKHEKGSAVTMTTWITEAPSNKRFHEVMCQGLSKFTKNNCYAISRALMQHALTAEIEISTIWSEQTHQMRNVEVSYQTLTITSVISIHQCKYRGSKFTKAELHSKPSCDLPRHRKQMF